MFQKQISIGSLLFLLCFFGFSSCKHKEIRCVIKGDVVGRESKTLLLFKASGDPRQKNIEIPIINNSFEYEIVSIQPEVYELIFKEEFDRGSFTSNIFFTEEGEIKFILYEEENEGNNIIEGGSLNNDLKNYNKILFDKFWLVIYLYNDSLDLLEEQRNIFNRLWNSSTEKAAISDGNRKQSSGITNEMYDNKSREYFGKIDSLLDEMMHWEFNYINENLSKLTLYLFMKDLKNPGMSYLWKEGDTALIDAARFNFQKFSTKYPAHPYILIVNDLLEGMKNIHEGGQFIDFSAPNMKQEVVFLSNVLNNNKVVLLDLWSTWCGPCIEKSREMLPVYAEFKDIGFEIVGVARGNGDKKGLNEFIEKENYPWINLIDFKNENNIWDKYSIPHKGGETFLITSSGKIIAIDPSVEEIKQKLEELVW